MLPFLQDLGLVDLEDYKHDGANITSLRLIDPDRPEVVNVRTDWLYKARRSGDSPLKGYSEIQVCLGPRLVYLAFFHLMSCWKRLRVRIVSQYRLICSKFRRFQVFGKHSTDSEVLICIHFDPNYSPTVYVDT